MLSPFISRMNVGWYEVELAVNKVDEYMLLLRLITHHFTCISRKPLIWASSTHAGLAARRQQIWPQRANWGMFEPSVVVAKGLAPTKPVSNNINRQLASSHLKLAVSFNKDTCSLIFFLLLGLQHTCIYIIIYIDFGPEAEKIIILWSIQVASNHWGKSLYFLNFNLIISFR